MRSSRWRPPATPAELASRHGAGPECEARGGGARPGYRPARAGGDRGQSVGRHHGVPRARAGPLPAADRLADPQDLLQQRPPDPAEPARPVRRPRQLRRAADRRPDLRPGARQHADLGDGGADRRRHARPAARRLPVRADPGLALLPRRLVQPGADLLCRGRRDLDVDLQLRLGGCERPAALAGPRRMGACLARRPAHGAVGDHPGRRLEMGRLPHGRVPRRPAFAAARGDRGGRARQLRLLEKAGLRRDPDDQDHAGGPADPRLHRQDEGVRPGLDHDQGRARCGAPRRSPPTPTSGRSNGRPSISATPRRSRWSRSCW